MKKVLLSLVLALVTSFVLPNIASANGPCWPTEESSAQSQSGPEDPENLGCDGTPGGGGHSGCTQICEPVEYECFQGSDGSIGTCVEVRCHCINL